MKSSRTLTHPNETKLSNRILILDSYHGDDSGSYSCFVSSSAECNQQADAAHINVVTASKYS